MGNCALCAVIDNRAATALLVNLDGKRKRVLTPVSVSEVMVSVPAGHVVSRACDLVRSLRISAMRPVERLVPGEVYLILPKGRVGSRIDYRLMAVIQKAMRKRRFSGNKVSPIENGAAMEKMFEKESGKCVSSSNAVACHCRRRSEQWRPFLSTIPESD